ncbi:MAG: hypothetical protein HY297_04630 [Thaumarchaeota archaeon]|nr:hypothetical protein [Nitrososphaerota archaeon]
MVDLEPLTQLGEMTSLVLVVVVFILYLALAAKTRSVRSLQFQIFIVVLVLFAAELPRIIWTLGIVDLGDISSFGLELHSVSMVFLSAFLAYRIYGFLRTK